MPRDQAPRAQAQSAIAQPDTQAGPPVFRARTSSTFLAFTAILVLAALSLTACGTGSARRSATSRIALSLERADLLLVARALQGAQASVQREVTATRQVWPLIAHGVPAEVPVALQREVSAANQAASEIRAPVFMTQAEGPVTRPRRDLTGPAAGIAGLFQSFDVLAEHGWTQIASTTRSLDQSSASTTRFLRANAPLYVASIYDGHFDLASIGKSLHKAYLKLGGSSGFSGSLRAYEVEKLTSFYGDGLRLRPHSVDKSL